MRACVRSLTLSHGEEIWPGDVCQCLHLSSERLLAALEGYPADDIPALLELSELSNSIALKGTDRTPAELTAFMREVFSLPDAESLGSSVEDDLCTVKEAHASTSTSTSVMEN